MALLRRIDDKSISIVLFNSASDGQQVYIYFFFHQAPISHTVNELIIQFF